MSLGTWGVLGSFALAGGLLVAPIAVHADLTAPTTHVVQPGETLSQIALDAGVDSATLASLNGLDDPNRLAAGQSLKLPSGAVASVATPGPSPRTYTVAAGDTLWAIAHQFDTSTDALVQLNSLDDADHLRMGAVLTLPSATGPVPAAASQLPPAASQPAAASPSAPVTASQPIATSTTPAPVASATSGGHRTVTLSYTVQAGETLSRIAHQFDVRASAIAQASGLDDPNKLSIGSVLKVPVPGKEHVVVAGETMRDIAAAEKVDLGSLIDFNELDDPGLIRVGQIVLLPVPATAVSPTAAASSGSVPAMPSSSAPATAAPGAAALAATATATPSAPAPTVTPAPAPAAGQVAASAPAQRATQPTPKPAAPLAVVHPPRGAPTDGLAGAGLKLLGTPYVWGGSDPSGFDCSGFVWYVARQLGKGLSRGMLGEYNTGPHPAREELKPGDLVFFQNTFTPGLSHNGIYIGNGQFVHAADEAAGVTISSLNTAYWAGHWFGATRLP